MDKTLTLRIPHNVVTALEEEARRTDKSLEEVAIEWISRHAHELPEQRPGSVDAFLPFFGAWEMTSGEREEIARIIERERHMEDDR
jgi:hypothetical protein